MKDKKTIAQSAHNLPQKQFSGRVNTKHLPSMWLYIFNLYVWEVDLLENVFGVRGNLFNIKLSICT